MEKSTVVQNIICVRQIYFPVVWISVCAAPPAFVILLLLWFVLADPSLLQCSSIVIPEIEKELLALITGCRQMNRLKRVKKFVAETFMNSNFSENNVLVHCVIICQFSFPTTTLVLLNLI